jgi:DNA-binding response OmpR family regulator
MFGMPSRPDRVLVIDDEPRVREVVAAYLENEGFRVDQAADAHQARAVLEGPAPDLVVLDVMFPGASGLDFLAELRAMSSLPVILLTARAEESDRILGLELGADDYVVKPFSPRELVARVRTVLRRSRPQPVGGAVSHGDLVVDMAAREVTVEDRPSSSPTRSSICSRIWLLIPAKSSAATNCWRTCGTPRRSGRIPRL